MHSPAKEADTQPTLEVACANFVSLAVKVVHTFSFLIVVQKLKFEERHSRLIDAVVKTDDPS
jgi:hypothetical protein